ncbi:MAG: DUF2752 domain-containing protein [Chthonomonadales bacterium]
MQAEFTRRMYHPINKAVLFCGAVTLGFTLVTAHFHANGPVCLSRTLFHMPCPGCGITRSLQSIWLGNLELSFQFHPLGIPLFLVCAGAILYWLLGSKVGFIRRMGEAFATFFRPRSRQIGAGIVYLGIYVVRIVLDHSGNHYFRW